MHFFAIFLLHKTRFHISMLAISTASAMHSLRDAQRLALVCISASICVWICARAMPFALSAVTHSRTYYCVLRPLYTRAPTAVAHGHFTLARNCHYGTRPLYAPSDIRAKSWRPAMLIRHSHTCSLPSRSCLC